MTQCHMSRLNKQQAYYITADIMLSREDRQINDVKNAQDICFVHVLLKDLIFFRADKINCNYACILEHSERQVCIMSD